jgi:hypothetical protein
VTAPGVRGTRGNKNDPQDGKHPSEKAGKEPSSQRPAMEAVLAQNSPSPERGSKLESSRQITSLDAECKHFPARKCRNRTGNSAPSAPSAELIRLPGNFASQYSASSKFSSTQPTSARISLQTPPCR